MARPITVKRGFSLLSVLLTIALISSLTILVFNTYSEISIEHLLFMNEYLKKQEEALTQRRETRVEGYPVSFYKSGRVNQARTLDFDRHKVIIHLGTGYLTYE